jgi:hypothetical protein
MAKDDTPPFRVIIERGGRLAPASAYDQERLDSYRPGTVLVMRLTEDDQDPMIKKWWLVLGRVIEHCDTPFTNKTTASDFFKTKLGILDVKMIEGQRMVGVGSLKDLTQREREEAVDQLIALIEEAFGVDVEALLDERPPQDKSDAPAPEPDVATGAEEKPPTSSAPEEPRAKLLRYARDILSKAHGTGKVEAQTLNAVISKWGHDITKMGEDDKAIARQITMRVKDVFRGEADVAVVDDEIQQLLSGTPERGEEAA